MRHDDEFGAIPDGFHNRVCVLHPSGVRVVAGQVHGHRFVSETGEVLPDEPPSRGRSSAAVDQYVSCHLFHSSCLSSGVELVVVVLRNVTPER